MRTERLIIREFNLRDAAFIVALLNDDAFLSYIGDKKVRTEADAREYLQQGPLKSYRLHGFGLFCVTLASTEEAVGMCGLIKRDELDIPDLGYAFLPQFTGCGYALEACSAILQSVKEQAKVERLAAVVMPSNERSQSLLRKLGFVQRGEMILYEEPSLYFVKCMHNP